jgi:hypothetical protein
MPDNQPVRPNQQSNLILAIGHFERRTMDLKQAASDIQRSRPQTTLPAIRNNFSVRLSRRNPLIAFRRKWL